MREHNLRDNRYYSSRYQERSTNRYQRDMEDRNNDEYFRERRSSIRSKANDYELKREKRLQERSRKVPLLKSYPSSINLTEDYKSEKSYELTSRSKQRKLRESIRLKKRLNRLVKGY